MAADWTSGVEQFGGVLGAGCTIQLDSRSGAALQHGEAGVEAGAAAGIGVAVDHHGEEAAGRGIEVVRHAMGRGDRDQPPARRQHRGGGAHMAAVGVGPAAVDTGGCREGRVHQHYGRADIAQPVGDALGVERGDHRLGEQARQQPGAGRRVFVEMERVPCPVAERTLCHHRQHAGASAGLQHDIARTNGGGLECRIGERQRGRELLEPDLLFRAPGVGRLQRRDRLQHRQHAARSVRSGAAGPPHAPAVTLEEQHAGGFGGLIGVLPDPAALGIGRAERLGHGVA